MDIFIGKYVEILPAYNSETSERDIWDEVAGCTLKITEIQGDDVKLEKGNQEFWVYRGRIRNQRYA